MESPQTFGQEMYWRLKENLINKDIVGFFGLTELEVANFLNTIKFSRGGISPMFLSPGFLSNDSKSSQILVPNQLGGHFDVLLHEIKHGLHYKICCVIFERPEMCLDAFRLFCENVLGDKQFVEFIEKRGSDSQRKFIQIARSLQEKQDLSPQDIAIFAVELGALTYQHAYFVDPRMCEAVASYKDIGMTKIVGSINRLVTSTIPYHDTLAMKGYGDKKSQSMFRDAKLFQKALLVKKINYNRDSFFSSK